MSLKSRKQTRTFDGVEPELRGASRFAVVPDYRNSAPDELASRFGAMVFSLTAFVVVFAGVLALFWVVSQRIGIVALVTAFVCALLVVSFAHIAQQWEKVVVLRLGRFSRVAGPGLFLTIPVVESCVVRIDQRIRTTPFGAEETLTSDLVPLDVDAVLFWMVWDAHLACTEVGDFSLAIELAAQTALRDAIGRAGVAEVAIRRNQLDKELKRILEEKVAPWGITVLSVEVRDILVPKALQDAMSLEAQAEQRKKARITLMEAEQDISEMLAEMDSTYAAHDYALRLRMMHLLYESVRETGGTVVIPSSFSETFKDIPTEDLRALSKLFRH
ncbi:MAG: slipin family protein [Coriobacteriales bacterium]|jgi:regulator of protease activity HflC (stomatin/prohibitin superfamily)|nr:slipin family protein [Coriobacteriales bacterium]